MLMFVTEEVSKLESLSDVSLEQLQNIWLMFLTDEVSKLERTSDVRLEQPENM